MPEPVFLLLLMVVTGLGVWTFLGQMNSGRLALPRIKLARPGLPSLPGKRRKKSPRERPARDTRPIVDRVEDEDDAGAFAAGRSPFVMPAPALALPPDAEDEYGELPANQVDFFADGPSDLYRGPVRRVTLASPGSPALDPDLPPMAEAYSPVAGGTAPVDGAPPPGAEPAAVYVVPASEPDPDDIMSFFDKAATTTTMPATLKESLESVSAAELLAEARQLRAIIQGRTDA